MMISLSVMPGKHRSGDIIRSAPLCGGEEGGNRHRMPAISPKVAFLGGFP